ncbi:MAG: DNA-binding protein [Allobaculum sp.]|nr:DNA-binding protein [Allobaculum sp.]MDE5758665.1 DNA-binding protein [Allobaculum sp.]
MVDHTQGNILFDLYGPLLTRRQQDVLEFYFQDDLSLTEIQENLSISKAAVYDALKKGVQAMEELESILHLQAKLQVIQQFLQTHPEYSEELGSLLE